MATLSQFDANRQNAQYSTGPRTDTGKSVSSRNSLTLGLYTRQDYVKPDERDLYKEFCETMHIELSPESLLEETLTSEITGASWRLRRCSAVEGDLADYAIQDPMLDETKEKTIRSIERARSSAHSLLHRSINQLRRLQTDRRKSVLTLQAPAPELALNCPPQPQPPTQAEIESLLQPPAEFLEDLDAILAEHAAQTKAAELASFCKSAAAPVAPLASFCKPAPQTPRNAQCPCKSGEKFKRCCGRNAPPVLGKVA